MKPLVFGVDYDGTYTADPVLFERFFQELTQRGHAFIFVTQRGPKWDAEMRKELGLGVTILHCDGESKTDACYNRGIHIDIWIDDDPDSLLHPKTYIGSLPNEE